MVYLKLILFQLQQLSRLGLWHAGAEMVGGDVLRARADRHRFLQIEASRLLRAQLLSDLTRLGLHWTADAADGPIKVPAE